MEVLKEGSIDERRVHTLVLARHTWMTPLIEYLQHGILPDGHEKAKNVRIKAPLYTIMDGVLYQKGFLSPWLKCVEKTKGNEALRETHSGLASTHEGARALTRLRMGIYCLTIHQDTLEVTRKCVEFQK